MLISSVHIRPWKPEDAGILSAVCNNKNIWLSVRDSFPFPYTIADAIQWIGFNLSKKPQENFAITYKGHLAGSIGVIIKEDIYRKTIEIGYFVGESFWAKGIATQAVGLLLQYIQQNFDVVRIYAEVFENNIASMKVLERNGFYLEGVRKKAVVKNNMIMDTWVWVKLV